MSSPTTDGSPFCGVTLLACFVVAQPFPDRHAATNPRMGAIHFASLFISVSSRSTRTASREVASDRRTGALQAADHAGTTTRSGLANASVDSNVVRDPDMPR